MNDKPSILAPRVSSALALALALGLFSCSKTEFNQGAGADSKKSTSSADGSPGSGPGSAGGPGAGDPGNPNFEDALAENPNGQNSNGTSTPNGGGDLSSCQKGDLVKLSFPREIQNCIDQGMLFNSDSAKCTGIKQAKFTCAFDKVIAELDKYRLNTAKVKAGQAEGAKLVGCGQSEDGLTVVAQWWLPPKDGTASCSFQQGSTKIVTGCYRSYPDDKQPSLETQEEIKAFVEQCLRENS